MKHYTEQDELFDLLQSLVSIENPNSILALVINILPIITSITLLILIFLFDLELIFEVTFVFSFLLINNGIIQLITILPDSDMNRDVCETSQQINQVFIRLSVYFCGIMLYSGHTNHTIISLVYILKVLRDVVSSSMYQCIFILSVLLIIFEALMLIIIKTHYSVDVYLSLFICYLLLTNENLLLQGASLLKMNEQEQENEYVIQDQCILEEEEDEEEINNIVEPDIEAA